MNLQRWRLNGWITFSFIAGILFGALFGIFAGWLQLQQTQSKLNIVQLADRQIIETQIARNTYLYGINHSVAELTKIDSHVLLDQMARRSSENHMQQFVMLKIDPKLFCSAVAANPTDNVIVMRPINQQADEIVNLNQYQNENYPEKFINKANIW